MVFTVDNIDVNIEKDALTIGAIRTSWTAAVYTALADAIRNRVELDQGGILYTVEDSFWSYLENDLCCVPLTPDLCADIVRHLESL